MTKTDFEKLKIGKKYLPRISSAKDLKAADSLTRVGDFVGKEMTLNGWVSNHRSSGKIMFIHFRDGRGDIQAVIEKSAVSEKAWKAAEELTMESSLQITGKVKKDDRSPFGYEIAVNDLKIIQISPEYPIGKKKHGPDFLLKNRHLWLRSDKQRAALLIRDEIFFSLTKFLREEEFVRVDTPIFQPVSCEDTTELFEVDYFGDKTYLTQSGQLYCEAAEYALGRTYDFGPVFRAEKSKTRKHLTEFWMMDAEMPFTTMEKMMDFEEKLLKRLISDVIDNQLHSLKIIGRDIDKLKAYLDKDFKRMPHRDVIDLLKDKYKQDLNYLDDIGTQEEKYLFKEFDVPVFITDWPAEIKAFYMPKFKIKGDDMDYVRSVDLVVPEGGGELMGGAEREFDFNKLLKTLEELDYPYEEYEWYMDLRKYGTVPHSGFGIGLERTVRWLGGIHHIRETIPFPRMINRLRP